MSTGCENVVTCQFGILAQESYNMHDPVRQLTKATFQARPRRKNGIAPDVRELPLRTTHFQNDDDSAPQPIRYFQKKVDFRIGM